jgi:hypothetical protein
MNRKETLNHVRSYQNIVKIKGPRKDQDESLPTTIDKGFDEFKGRRVEILPTDGVVWCIASEWATQSWTEAGGGWSAMELKELASDC